MRDVLLPGSIEELWSYMDDRPGASMFAGGTDLLVKMYNGMVDYEALICLERIEELKEVREHEGSIRIGACATHSQLIGEPLVRKWLPALWKAVREIGSPPVRNMGTIGGNICTASPAADTLPPLYAMKAEVELLSRQGARRAPIAEFIRGPGATGLQKAEILSAVWVTKPARFNLHHFEKVGLRSALACSVVSLAALVRLTPGGVVEEASLAWGSVAPTVFTCQEAERALAGRPMCGASLSEAADIVRRFVSPISDVRADGDYRRLVAGNLLLRLLDKKDEGRGGENDGS
ncbi:MAG: xanthine dehydrogenase family protein subunit M [Syntrophobacteraceae bacterium]|nr:xanthine dehydrogenase family protein subunit M [Syntrophobacteraceae bacterium]